MKPKLISENELDLVEDILKKWSGKLTWDKFAVRVASALGKDSVSKFTLMGYPEVKQAFNRRKQTLKKAKSQVIETMGDVTIDMLVNENAELRNQIHHLEEEFEAKERLWIEQYRRWQYNLSMMPNVDLSTLNQPLPTKQN
jgi:hypothetical protein